MNTVDVNKVWDQALSLLYTIKETNSPLAKAWLNYLVPISLDNEKVVFAVKLLQAKNWIEGRYLSYIKQSIAQIIESPREVVLIIDETRDHHKPPLPGPSSSSFEKGKQETFSSTQTPQHAFQQTPSIKPLAESPSQPLYVGSTSLYHQAPVVQPAQLFTTSEQAHPQNTSQHDSVSAIFYQDIPAQESGHTSVYSSYTSPSDSKGDATSRFNFSNYVMGNSNEYAYKTSIRVAENPGLYFNPLFIYGKSGLGKTHLLLAIKNYINTYLLDKKVVYAPITEVVNDFTNAMAGDRDLTSFKRKYHTCDVLLVDDVQTLEGKEGTTDALFEIFNMFIESKKQIVLSADRSPVEINIDERYTSRFAQGITADIRPPNYEMKAAILKNYKRYYCNFLNIHEVEFSDEAIQKIVELSGSNIRELEGAISNLIVYVSCRPEEESLSRITYEDVENILGEAFFRKNDKRVDFDAIMKVVESYFKITRAELLSEKRSKNISYPRQIAMYLIRRYTDMSYPEIGDSFNKDHTTVMYADKNIQSKIVEEVSTKNEVERIAELLTT